MKILWVTNIVLPEASEKLNLPVPQIGGWLQSLLEDLGKNGEIELAVASVSSARIYHQFVINGIQYFIIPSKTRRLKHNKSYTAFWSTIVSTFNPDIVHIHGTEFAHGIALMREYPQMKYIISIQGLCGIIERYYYSGITLSEILKNITFRDIIRNDSIIHARQKFKRRGEIEQEYILRTRHVIGRTTWDFVHAKAINEGVNYHFCNENLRSPFYQKHWHIDGINRCTIFLSQGEYPIKGLHIVLKALNILKKKYPSIQVNIAGNDITLANSPLKRIKLSGYARYLKRLIKKYSLEKVVKFTGLLNAEQMAQYYQNSNVFICPSSIENSPNSLGEAQLIGIPCIAAYVGGIPDMVKDGESGLLYRFEEYEMLAYNIDRIFKDDLFAKKLSQEANKVASDRHNRLINTNKLISIYKEL